jgi:putative pyruvate formate lyase activating enzyme
MLHQSVKNTQTGFNIFEPDAAPSIPGVIVPGYIHLLDTGELYNRVSEAYQRLESCDLCPRRCGINRRAGELGTCRTGVNARLSSYGPHMGEEDVLRGERGSGTVFFAGCTLHCQFCQNHSISQTSAGKEVSADDLAGILLELQDYGCHNINFVTPDHVVPQILAAVLVAAKKGLHIPLVWNSGGYDSTDTLRLLDGIIDIYLPDMKFSSAQAARRYAKAGDYPQVNRDAVREMHRQVGDLILDQTGRALRGLLVRHLVLPHNMAGTEDIMRFLAEEISPDTYVNIMPQYKPAFQAHLYASLNRPVYAQEYENAVDLARQAGLTRLHGVG